MAHHIDLRKCLNAISDVVNNRPHALREFDQIFMKTADMLLQAEHVSRWFSGRRVVFIGDGDAIGLCLVHLHQRELLEHGPKSVHVLDFDERVVLSVRGFAARYGIADRVTAELYNVAFPLPVQHWRGYDGFYTNPPFGASNDGRSIEAFLLRGFEAVTTNGIGCVVIADDREFPWTRSVLFSTQSYALSQGFVISELVPEFHHYHLDDSPDLRSCSIALTCHTKRNDAYASEALPKAYLDNFYGRNSPLRAKFVRDRTAGGKRPSNDHEIEPL
ncbi:MAG TPA: bis-aminopropyl spermidine synthase family protein [Pirellulales bacterium]|nr:bis-aminopropyl spermidine synthase family protein [Pirellulales bacterium]